MQAVVLALCSATTRRGKRHRGGHLRAFHGGPSAWVAYGVGVLCYALPTQAWEREEGLTLSDPLVSLTITGAAREGKG